MTCRAFHRTRSIFHSISSRTIDSAGISRCKFHSCPIFHQNVLPFIPLRYNSVEIDVDAVDVSDTSVFSASLFSTISHLKRMDKTSVFLKVPMIYAHYIPIAGMYGFKFHHAEGDYASLLLWLGPGESKVPPFATHHCGVGGLLFNTDCSKVLVVKEKDKQVGWKLPGGYCMLGEDFAEASTREVFEETGIRASFNSILGVRHSHAAQFNRSDIYVICHLKLSEPTALDHNSNPTIKIDEEIEDAQWMPVSEFRAQSPQLMLHRVLNDAISG